MANVISVSIHSSQFPEKVRQDLLDSFRTRKINHKFHYDSIKQTLKWLALHEAYSPSRRDARCLAIYEKGFRRAAAKISSPQVHLFGLGCGGGQKDARLLAILKKRGRTLRYTPADVSVAMTLVASETASRVISARDCFPFVCDLTTAKDVAKNLFATRDAKCARLFTFFGMIPNFEPQHILPQLAGLLRPKDWLLFSANLAPGENYDRGVEKILPLYDNDLTRDWLRPLLDDLGVLKNAGKITFAVENISIAKRKLKRVAAHFHFTKSTEIYFPEARFRFCVGEKLRLFFSYRYTPKSLREMLGEYQIEICEEWVTAEEGVFLCRKRR